MKTLWIDALTPKQALLSIKIMEEAEEIGFKSIITTREYDYTTGIFERKNVEAIIMGRHGGEKLEGKLMASLERSIKLAEFITKLDEKPSYHISLSSPEAVRVAFGLSIPIIITNDTPHSKYVNKLTIPLADKLIIPKAVPIESYKGMIEEEKIIQYNGVDELSWIKSFKIDPKVPEELGLNKDDKIIIAREAEYKASYYKWVEKPVIRIIRKILNEFHEVRIVYFPRYEDEMREIPKNVIVPEKAIDTISLMKYSILTISGGGTMARESALIGTPSISLFPTLIHVNKWLEEIGLPIKSFRNVEEAYEYLKEIIMNPEKYKTNTEEIIRGMEDPVEIIVKILRGECNG
ncbi:MAG: DUF354 domain-containing protein [Candidatus Methanomethylicia archaeon]